MTGKCTHECTEYGHSDSCWMPGQPSPTRTKSAKSGPKLSTFVPYQEREGQERLMADSSSKPHGEERSGGGSNKVASIRFLPPYTSAYSAGGDSGKDCPREEIPWVRQPITPLPLHPPVKSPKEKSTCDSPVVRLGLIPHVIQFTCDQQCLWEDKMPRCQNTW